MWSLAREHSTQQYTKHSVDVETHLSHMFFSHSSLHLSHLRCCRVGQDKVGNLVQLLRQELRDSRATGERDGSLNSFSFFCVL